MLSRLILPALLLPPTLADPQDEARPLEWGREHTALFCDGELDSVWERMGPEIRALLGGDVAGLEASRRQLW